MIPQTKTPRWLLLIGDIVADVFDTEQQARKVAEWVQAALKERAPLGGYYGSIEVAESHYYAIDPAVLARRVTIRCEHGLFHGELCHQCVERNNALVAHAIDIVAAEEGQA